jgi:hypothetical protein
MLLNRIAFLHLSYSMHSLFGKFQDYVVRLSEKSVISCFLCVVQDLESLRLFKFLSIVLPTYTVIHRSLF